MSFVSIIARADFITVMSDGCVTDNSGVVQEDYQKFVQITPELFLAFTGHAPAGELLLKAFEQTEFDKLAPRLNFDQVFFIIKNLIENIFHNSKLKILLAFGGRNRNGEIEAYYINSIDMQTGHYVPKGNQINTILLGNSTELNGLLKQFLATTGDSTPKQILAAQKLLNDHVAVGDPSVNTTTFELIIDKQPA